MNLLVVFALCLVAVSHAAPPSEYEPVKIIRSEFDQQPEGGYQFGFESEDGTSRQETGEVKEVLDEENKPQIVVVSRGSYSYKDTDGNQQSINYVADETGFHAEGPSIPK